MRLLLVLILSIFSLQAISQEAPFIPEVDSRFKVLEKINVNSAGQAKHVARISFSAVGGKAIGTYGTGIYLPKKSIIDNSTFYFERGLYDAGSGTVAVQCEDAGNILTAADYTSQGTYPTDTAIKGNATTGPTPTRIKSIAAVCEVKVVVGGAAMTDGILKGWFEYVSYE